MKKSLAERCNPAHPHLPIILVALFCLQPILDILSYWQDALGISFSLSFVPRTLVLIFLFFGGFALSDRKKYYWILVAVLGVFFAGHTYANITNGYISPVEDTSNLIRVLQLPITTFAMITCLRCNERSYDAIWRGILYSLIILAITFVISTTTKTDPMTYPDQGVGVRGYSFWANAQSAILSLSAPMAIGWVLKKHHKTLLDTVLVLAVIVVSLGTLYVHGTRLSYACMLMTSLGMALVIFISGEAPKRFGVILLAFTAAGIAVLLPWSNWLGHTTGIDNPSTAPVEQNQEKVAQTTKVKERASQRLYQLGEAQMKNGVSSILINAHIVERPTGIDAFALPAPLTTSAFTDVSPDDWRTKYLAYCQTLGLIGGIDSTYCFAPDADMPIVQAICIADNVYERYTGKKEYQGYAGDSWYAGYVKRAEAYGLIPEGVESDDDLQQSLTRGQAAWLIYNMMDEKEYPKTHDIDMPADLSENTPYANEIITLLQAGLIVRTYPGQNNYEPDAAISRGDFVTMLASAINPSFRICDRGYTPLAVNMPESDLSGVTEEMWKDGCMNLVYGHYLSGLVGRFGLHAVLDAYDYTLDIQTLISEREWKLQYCYLLMDESTPISRLFGMEVSRMFYQGLSYDVENDFHGIYFLYGWVGLGLLLAFLGYFAFLLLKAIFTNFKRYFTLEMGSVCIALVASLVHAYFTCGVLRRANTLFYCAGLLAVVYYLTVMKQYPDKPKKATKKERREKNAV